MHNNIQIKDRFVQADIEDKRALEGSGLGLAITKSYFEMLDGKIPIYAQTAYAMVSDREKALEAGCIDYISKPIECDYFEKMINKLH